MLNLEEEFIRYVESQSLFNPLNKVILAVSGGIDSMVMVDLFHRAKISITIAHCNFGLRGVESDGDELLVGSIANKYRVGFIAKCFDTEEYAKKSNVSIQIAARELRYDWFSKLSADENIETVALAHHADDVAETMLINLCRGTGISGLHGILPRNGIFIRPLLFAQRSDIEAYAAERKIKYREDSTNKKDKYVRNNIRLNVLPALKKSYPEVIQSFSKSAHIIANQELVYRKSVNEFLSKITQTTALHSTLSIAQLLEYVAPEVALFEFLHPFGFNSSQVNDILGNIQRHAGATYESATHQVVRDRTHLFLSTKEEKQPTESYFINDIFDINHLPISLSFDVLKNPSSIKIKDDDPNSITVDGDKLIFPLVLRKWEQGDYFYPFGMKGRKKVSDFFQDLKIPTHLKSHIYILESNKKIIWIVGYRMSELVKVDTHSKNVIKIIVD